MLDHIHGITRDVAETKFLIHDLRVERFIDEIIHFHVALDTDLELYGITEAEVLQGEDLRALRAKAVDLRAAFVEYTAAVQGFAGPERVLKTGNAYIQAIYDLCETVLHPLWSHIEHAMSLLPPDSRSVRSRSHYRNSIRWLCGVYYRIEHFWAERRHEEVYEVFDVAADIEDYIRNVVYGYVTEKSAARVELQLGRLDSAILGGNRHRFRRMYFNLIMNAVDAMGDKKVGVINISDVTEGDDVILIVRDDASGMTPDKVQALLADRDSLEGELHSLGFVFVRQTVADFGGTLTIDSTPGVGTTISIRLPVLQGVEAPPKRRSRCEQYDLSEVAGGDRTTREEFDREHRRAVSTAGRSLNSMYGHLVYSDYKQSEAEFPGCIFAIGITPGGRVDLFSHKPYERYWNIGHEDLLPMFYQSTLRGRLEENEEKIPAVIFKAPQSIRDYFEMREVPESERNAERFVAMVRDEMITSARVLIDTGLPANLEIQIADGPKFFPEGEPSTVGGLGAVHIGGET